MQFDRLRRRDFISLLGGAATAAWPRLLRAQPMPGKIGYLHPVTISPSHATFSVLRKEWQRLGYVEGETLLARSSENDPQQLPGLVRELTRLGVGVLIVVGADVVRAAARTTKTTPIVAIDMETDPVRTGLISSYARPGGNVTGLFLDMPVLATKWLELMREMVPSLDRIVFLWQPSTGRSQVDAALGAAKTLHIEATVLEIDVSDDFAAKLSNLAGPNPNRIGLIQLTFPGITTVAARFAAAAEKVRLPTISFLRAATKLGLLMSYGPSQEEYFPRAVHIADRILRGDKVADVPIERPSKFEFVVNLRTAKVLGLEVPPMLLALADEVIE
jgi:putative tryptophan/tyrosine transport system substrate-binding protein